MNYLAQFQNPRIVESVFYDAWAGLTLYHNRPESERVPSKSVEEMVERVTKRLQECLDRPWLYTEPALASILGDYKALESQIGSQGFLDHCRVVEGQYLRLKVQPDLCSDKMYSYIVSLGYVGPKPSPQEARRIVGKLKRK